MLVYVTCAHVNKIKAIKIIRALTRLGLKEAKDVVDAHCNDNDGPIPVESVSSVDAFLVLRDYNIGEDYVTSMDSFTDYLNTVSRRRINETIRDCMEKLRSATSNLAYIIKAVQAIADVTAIEAEQLVQSISNEVMSGALDVSYVTLDYVISRAKNKQLTFDAT